VSITHKADWIRYAGVMIAFAGVLIAAPDGVAEAWRPVSRAGRKARASLARVLPFLRRSATVQGVAAQVTVTAHPPTIIMRRDWHPYAAGYAGPQRRHWTAVPVSRCLTAHRHSLLGHPVPTRDLGLCYLRLTGSA
jgi:hypothetical protein